MACANEKSVCVVEIAPLITLKEALVIEEMAIVKFKKEIKMMNLLINDDKMETITNDLIYIMCNRIRSYIIEHPNVHRWDGKSQAGAQPKFI